MSGESSLLIGVGLRRMDGSVYKGSRSAAITAIWSFCVSGCRRPLPSLTAGDAGSKSCAACGATEPECGWHRRQFVTID